MANDIEGGSTPPASDWTLMALKPEAGVPPVHVGMLAFPGLTLLDLIGPQTALTGPTTTHLIWKSTDMIVSDAGVALKPTMTFADTPLDLDVLFVPGGPGQVEVMRDPEVLAFLADRGSRARYVTSVCTGSIILGAAGLLRGYRATSHWAARPLLAAFGAEPTEGRIVVDRNRITGGGVTAGMDFGLALLAELFDEDVAKTTQLLMEYDPQPPFDCGNPAGAGEDRVRRALEVMAPVAQRTMAAMSALAVSAAS